MRATKATQIGDNISKGNDFMTVAVAHDNKKEYEEAFKYYKLAIEYFELARKYEKSPPRLKVIYIKMEECLTRAELLKKYMDEQQEQQTDTSGGSATKPNRVGKDKDDTGKNNNGGDAADEKEKVSVNDNIIVTTSPNVKFEDILGLVETKKSLQAALIWPIKFADLYRANNTKPSRSMLLYGPPGTGKTQLAKAVATEMKCTFITVGSTDIMSKWLGESEKIMRRIFEIARERAPSVVFFDEVDGILSSRTDSNTSEASNKVKNEILTNMDGFQGLADNDKFVFFLAATNNPAALDIAIVRRFQQRLYIPLPDADVRCLMFKKKLEGCQHLLADDDYTKAAEMTNQYSGADIETVVRYVKESALRKYADSEEFKLDPADNKYIPLKYAQEVEGEPVKIKFNDMTSEQVRVLPILVEDIMEAIAKNRPSTSSSDSKKYDDFTAKYGSLGI